VDKGVRIQVKDLGEQQTAYTARAYATYNIKITKGKVKESLTNQPATFDLKK
jgi:hypothetical protein